MQFTKLTLAVLATGAVAQLPTDSVGASVLNVLATAIPASSISAALANPTSFANVLASSLSAGNTPSWYNALPSDVKSYLPKLYPAGNTAVSTAPSAYATGYSAASGTAGTVSGAPAGSNSTTISSVSSATLSATGGSGAGGATATTKTASTGGAAAYPTAVYGAGVAGALGFLGMLAL